MDTAATDDAVCAAASAQAQLLTRGGGLLGIDMRLLSRATVHDCSARADMSLLLRCRQGPDAPSAVHLQVRAPALACRARWHDKCACCTTAAPRDLVTVT